MSESNGRYRRRWIDRGQTKVLGTTAQQLELLQKQVRLLTRLITDAAEEKDFETVKLTCGIIETVTSSHATFNPIYHSKEAAV